MKTSLFLLASAAALSACGAVRKPAPAPAKDIIFGYCVYEEDGEPIRFVGDIITNDMGNLVCGWTSCKFFNPANWPEANREAWRKKAHDDGTYFMTIYARDWEDIAPYKAEWGSHYLGNNIGEYASYLYQAKTSYPKGEPCDENLLQARDRFVGRHIAKAAKLWNDKGCPYVFSTCGSALACHEQDGGLDFVCNEIFAVGAGNLAYATAECRGSARKYGPEWWSSWYAHDWYTKETPFDTKQKFDLLTVSLRQSYLMGTSLMVLESGTQANQAWKYTAQSETVREPATAIQRYDDPIPTRYRRTMKAFWDWLKAHPRAEGSPETDIALVMGNLDAYVGCYYPDWPAWSQYDTMEKQPLYKYGDPEKTWTIAQEVFFPKPKDAVKPFPNDHLAASPYGQVDVMQIDDKSTAKELARYKLLVYAGWNTMTPKVRAVLVAWVKKGGTLVLCRPHLSTRIDRDYANYAESDLLDVGFAPPAPGKDDEMVEKRLGRGKVCLFTSRKFPAASPELAAAYERTLRKEASALKRTHFLKPAAGAEGDFGYFAYAVYGPCVYILNLDLVAPRKVTYVTPKGARTLTFAPCEIKTERK